MSIREFIRKNRKEIDRIIRGKDKHPVKLNDDDRYKWIINHEGLYNWARSEGVKI